MNQRSEESSDANSTLGGISPWIPEQACRDFSPLEVKLSKGFLRSSPGRWFPGLAAHWLPLFHSTGIEFQILEVVPVLKSNQEQLDFLGAWTIDDEPLALFVEAGTRGTLTEVIMPNSGPAARRVLLEYLARRVASSLQSSWSGTDNSTLSFDSEFSPNSFRPLVWIKVRTSINNTRMNFSFGLGKLLSEKLDGLWRRQLRPSSLLHANQSSTQVRIELARLAVAPQTLPSYLKAGSLVDLEIPLNANLILRIGEEGWLSANLGQCSGHFVLETIANNPPTLQIHEGATPVSIEFGSLNMDAATIAELEQPGAILDTALPLSEVVQLCIRGERVGRAQLHCFEGRFAISVL